MAIRDFLGRLFGQDKTVSEVYDEAALHGDPIEEDENEKVLSWIRALPQDTKVLDMSGQPLRSLSGVDLPGDLRVLNLSRTNLTSLEGVRLPDNLQKLDLSRTHLKSLEGVKLPAMLRELDLSNTKLTSLKGVELPADLRTLNLSITKLTSLEGVEFPANLQELTLSRTNLTSLEGVKLPDNLLALFLGGAKLVSLDGVVLPPNMQWLDLSGTDLTSLSNAELPENLQMLNVSNTKLMSLDGVVLPENLAVLYLYSTPITHLPESIRKLRNLRKLDLGNLELEELPDWLPELGLPFTRKSLEDGICLYYTTVRGIDMSIFDRSQQAILQWFGERNRAKLAGEEEKPLNELKVVFLGDGEAGKSHTIARLLNDGKQVISFRGVSTPGIVIEDKTYQVGGQEIKVHFWDFGGQEILHSMHRMFLTKRTLYVLVLNVREGNQDERARYWLHNLKSFADGAPVMVVLNKMDMNRNASVNEADLRRLYPGLMEVVKLSTLTYSDEEFRQAFLDVLMDRIGKMDILAYPFTAAWSRLKERLQGMSDNYIFGEDFRRYCEEAGVQGSDKLRRELLEWFSDLGVSFCYSDSASLEDYVVLRPDWITNAIYIILFNKIDTANNGLVSHEAIYRMLSSKDTEQIRRTVTDAVYRGYEVDYVLKVFRKFRLSFWVDDRTEFLPMLCDARTPDAAAEYEDDPDALEFRMHYAYLPGNVIHRLMVDRRRELDLGNVWLTGARFVYPDTGLSAVVKTEGELLRILVRAEQQSFRPQLYLGILKKDLERINAEMGLEPLKNEVVYKLDGKTAYFDYDDLIFDWKMGQTHVNSRALGIRIAIDEILKQTDQPADKERVRIIRDLLSACGMLQDSRLYWKADEDSRTSYIRDLLTSGGYVVLDQHLVGEGKSGRRPGELDLDIRLEPNVHWTAMEALNLSGSSDSQLRYWNEHLDKLLTRYNAPGRAFLFHVSYLSCSGNEFSGHCVKFRDHMRSYSPAGFRVLSAKELDRRTLADTQRLYTQSMECVYDCGGVTMTVYHFFVRIGE